MPSSRSLTKGVAIGLYSAPWNIKNPSPASYMHIHEWHLVCICIMTRCTKKHLGYQTVTPTASRPFWFKVLISPHFDPFPCLVLQQTPPKDWKQQTSNSLSIILKPWKWKVIKSFGLGHISWVHYLIPTAAGHQIIKEQCPRSYLNSPFLNT